MHQQFDIRPIGTVTFTSALQTITADTNQYQIICLVTGAQGCEQLPNFIT